MLIDRGVDAEAQISAAESGFAEALRDFPDKFPPSGEVRKTVSDFVLFQIVRDPKKLAQYDDGEKEGTALKDHRLVALGLLMNDPGDPPRRCMLEDSGLLEFREDVRADIDERCWLLYEAPAAAPPSSSRATPQFTWRAAYQMSAGSSAMLTCTNCSCRWTTGTCSSWNRVHRRTIEGSRRACRKSWS